MNPIHWIRWKVLIFLAVLIGGTSLFGLNPLARIGIKRLGSVSQSLQCQVQDIHLSPWAGHVSLTGFDLGKRTTPSGATTGTNGGRIMSAESITFDLNMMDLLRRRYQGELHVRAPKLILERNADGSMNINTVTAETGESETRNVPTDWWATAQKWIDQIQQWDDRRRQIPERIPEEAKERLEEAARRKASRFRVDYSKRVSYPFDNMVRFVAKRIVGEGLEISFLDHSPDGQPPAAIPPLKNGRIEITDVSDNPIAYSEPIQWTITGEIDNAPIKLSGSFDQRAGRTGDRAGAMSALTFDFEADGLPIQLVQYFAGDRLPVHFDKGRVRVAARGVIGDWNQLDVDPVFGFRDAVVSPRAGARAIAGLDPEMFCRAFNELGTLELKDMHVAGTVRDPDIDIGNTLTDLVRSGGKAIARKQIDKGLEMGAAKVNEALGGQLEKMGVGKEVLDAGKAVDTLKGGFRGRFNGLPLGDKSGESKVRR